MSPQSGNGRQPARARRTALAAGSPPRARTTPKRETTPTARTTPTGERTPTARTTPASTQISRSARQRAIRELVGRRPFESQAQLVRELTDRGFVVTQATVSRDIAELGLVKVTRGGRHVYVAPEDLAPRPVIDDRLRRVLADTSVTVGRSGLILVLTSSPGTANTIAQGIDESSLHEQEGTLAGDNTLLVLFADEERLERWLRKFREMQGLGLPDPGRPMNETRRSQEADR